jgi:cell division protein FtsW
MGERTFVSSKSAPAALKQRVRIHLDVDVPLLLILITLVILGLLMVYSASWDFSLLVYDNPTQIFTRQLMWLGLGTLVAAAAAFFDYHYWQRLALPLMALTVAALIVVLVLGELRLGATRSLTGGSIQPSELAKLATILYLGVWLNAKRDQLDSWGFGLLPLSIILGLVGALIFLQPDLSATITIFLLGGLLFFLAGGDLRQISLLILSALLFGWIIVQFSPTGSERVASFLAGLSDPTKASYHVQRSLEAFVRGNWFGVGIGRAETKLTGLPVPPTDSIFAVVGEETGVMGAAALVMLYGLLMWRSLVIARRAPDTLGTLLASGLGLWLVMEALINMAVMVGLMPFAGNALPFISAGGSSLVVSLMAIGILFNISRFALRKQAEKERVANAFINLRRRDGRRRVSRPGRAASPETPQA